MHFTEFHRAFKVQFANMMFPAQAFAKTQATLLTQELGQCITKRSKFFIAAVELQINIEIGIRNRIWFQIWILWSKHWQLQLSSSALFCDCLFILWLSFCLVSTGCPCSWMGVSESVNWEETWVEVRGNIDVVLFNWFFSFLSCFSLFLPGFWVTHSGTGRHLEKKFGVTRQNLKSNGRW